MGRLVEKKHDNWFIFTFFSKSDREVNTLLPLFDICGDKTNIKVEIMWVYFVQKLIISSRWFSLIKFHFGVIWTLFSVNECLMLLNVTQQEIAKFALKIVHHVLNSSVLNWNLWRTTWREFGLCKIVIRLQTFCESSEQIRAIERGKLHSVVFSLFTHILASDKS